MMYIVLLYCLFIKMNRLFYLVIEVLLRKIGTKYNMNDKAIFASLIIIFSLLSGGCTINKKQNKHAFHSINIYQSKDELVNLSYHKLGSISGSSCQLIQQDRPVTINDARNDLRARASRSQGNAVLLNHCDIMSSSLGCYRLAICEGTLLQVNINAF